MVSRCILCDESPTTAAHLIPRPVRRLLPKLSVHTTYRLDGAVLEERGSGKGLQDVQPKVLCRSCNGIWMSEMEIAATPTLEALYRDQEIELTEDTCFIVANWMTAFSIVRGEMDSSCKSFQNVAARRFRWEGIKALSVEVWLIRSVEGDGADLPPEDYAHTILNDADFGRSGFMVMLRLGSNLLALATTGHRVVLERAMNELGDSATRLYPSGASVGKWPVSLSRTTSQVFAAIGLEQGASAGAEKSAPEVSPGTTRYLRIDVPSNLDKRPRSIVEHALSSGLAKIAAQAGVSLNSVTPEDVEYIEVDGRLAYLKVRVPDERFGSPGKV